MLIGQHFQHTQNTLSGGVQTSSSSDKFLRKKKKLHFYLKKVGRGDIYGSYPRIGTKLTFGSKRPDP